MQPISFLSPLGYELQVRTVRAQDRAFLQQGMELLSAESIYYRFNSYLVTLSKQQLDYLTSVDQRDHVAIGAVVQRDEQPVGVGIGRYIRHRQDPQQAELALTVIDPFQRQGVGSLLLAGLSHLAHRHGVRLFTMQLHTTRTNLIEQLRKMNAIPISQTGGVAELRMPVLSRQALNSLPHQNLQCVLRAFEQGWA
jgi:GNAT superfamily N-acetyltransferase